jgi:hypothetical protein
MSSEPLTRFFVIRSRLVELAMAPSFLYLGFTGALQSLRLKRREGSDLAIEVVMLRHEVAVLPRQITRPALRPPDRALLARLVRLLDCRFRGGFSVQPDTLVRWHRDLVRRKRTQPHCPRRPGIPAGTVAIILQLALENPTWGCRRIQGELAGVGVLLAPSSVWSAFRRHRIDPSPMRTGPSLTAFSRTQASSLLACDFFSVDAVLLKCLYVLFFVDLDTRRVWVTGISAHPEGSWIVQQARMLTLGRRHLGPVLATYVAQCNEYRPHRRLNQAAHTQWTCHRRPVIPSQRSSAAMTPYSV